MRFVGNEVKYLCPFVSLCQYTVHDDVSQDIQLTSSGDLSGQLCWSPYVCMQLGLLGNAFVQHWNPNLEWELLWFVTC